MGRLANRRWSLLVVSWAACMQIVLGAGKLDIHFKSLNSNGEDYDGGCCDVVCSNPCDPFFNICIDRHGGTANVGDCSMYQAQTGVFHEQNGITFGSSMLGVANPIIIPLRSVPNDFVIKVKITDSDPANAHDLMDNLYKSVMGVIPKNNGEKGSYTYVELRQTNKLVVHAEVRSYCDTYFYGDHCTKRCQDNELGHYTCDKTGDKICSNGWTGQNCDQDIDECAKGVCKHGANCTNLDGSHQCDCQFGFKGVFCEDITHECAINPCVNGGTCYGNETDYRCDCLPWWGGMKCEVDVNPCDTKPCFNNATCLYNNGTTTGYSCGCEFKWTGERCDVELTTTTTSTTTTTTSIIDFIGDPYIITLLGVIDHTNIDELEDGLIRLINDLGQVPVRVHIKVKFNVITTKTGDTVTNVEFVYTGPGGPIDFRHVDGVFTGHTDDEINRYLPLPLYRPRGEPPKQERQTGGGSWASDNWWAIVLPILIAFILVACIVAFLVVSRRKKKEEKEFLRCDSNVSEPQPHNMAFENVLYHETNRQQPRESDVLDGGAVTLTPNGTAYARQLPPHGACADELNPYMQPVQYDTPVKQFAGSCNSAGQYQNSNLATLDTRGEAGANDYTDFSDLEGAKAKEENPYQELDDVMAQKIALAVGLPDGNVSDTNISMDDSDDEDDIDKIKASFKENHSVA